MSIHEELRAELREAMRSKDQQRLAALRQVESEAAVVKTAPGFSEPVDDAFYQRVIAAYVKKMQKARDEYAALGPRAQAMAEGLAFEVEYLGRWLPKKLDEAATRALVRGIIAELGVTGAQAAGRVTGQVLKQHKDAVDGALVNRLVRDELAAPQP
ncbi:MAG: GatB/YqeY domain-containing protein [Proteobacteria bacterium]|nr:GatB/YqeY domain-containing protein [Pseudomonadota bacterium]